MYASFIAYSGLHSVHALMLVRIHRKMCAFRSLHNEIRDKKAPCEDDSEEEPVNLGQSVFTHNIPKKLKNKDSL